MGLQQSNIIQNGLFQDAMVGVSAVTLILSSVTTGSFTIPSNVTSFTVEAIGGGAAGWGGGIDNVGYAGGGGGGYARSIINTAQSGFTYYYSIGAGGNGLTDTSQGALKIGGNTMLSSSTYSLLLRACGGGNKYPVSSTNIQFGGGNSIQGEEVNIGQVTYYGGNGATGAGTPTKKTGGGGGAAGSTGNGLNGSQSDGNRGVGSGGTGTDNYGGDGGNSYPVDTELGWQYGDGSAGTRYGGGGGGGASNGVSQTGYGGNGASGIMIVSYNIPNY
jgi:hypothetical protein